MKQGYREVLHLPSYRKVLIANFINRLGDCIDMIAFSWLTYQITQSASWSAIMFAVNQLPPILFMPFTGALIENLNKKHVIIFCDILRGICTALFALLYMHNMLHITWILGITFLNNTFECFRIPASTALLPKLLPKEQYEFGLSLNASLSNITELIGIGISGIILAVVGVFGAILIDVGSFLLCVIIFMTLHFQEQINHKQTLSFASYRQTLLAGFHYVNRHQLLRIMMYCSVLCNAVIVPFNSYQAAFVSGVLHLDAQVYTALSFALSLGLCIGAFLLPYLHKHFTTRNLFLYPFYSMAIYYLVLSFAKYIENPTIATIYLCSFSFICGIGLGIAVNSCDITVMKIIDHEYLSRANSLLMAMSRAAMPITSFLLSLLSLSLSIPQIFCLSALFTFILITGMMFLKILKQLP